ncbi:unnamed protein product [Lepeophtheirus salmonis]|uniref:(salmon louse) hypothetical protein n=1 Tax=Lepeophtheirus salmonis TaxID=72036 RepID=A0A7R8CL30_LEPSM|nr:unnamed protein product [Lepeophtheirus salmonis]CAF2853587.1 unnamed protein product [Lepeophtheirus salmonis]
MWTTHDCYYVQKSAAVLNKSRTENQMEIISEAFKSLSPKKTDDILLPAVEYKKQMNELLKKEGLTIDDLTPWKTLFVPSNNNKVFNYLDYVEKLQPKRPNVLQRLFEDQYENEETDFSIYFDGIDEFTEMYLLLETYSGIADEIIILMTLPLQMEIKKITKAFLKDLQLLPLVI